MIGLLLAFSGIGVCTIGWRWPRFAALGKGLDLCGDVLGVVFHPSEQRGAAGVLPGQAEKVESRQVGYPPVVADPSCAIQYRGLDPGVVGLVSGGPYDCVHAEVGAVSEAHGVV